MASAGSQIQEVTAQMEYIETHFSNNLMPNEALKAVFDRAIADSEKQHGLALTVPEKTRIWAKISSESLFALRQEFEGLLLEHVVTSKKPKDHQVAQNLEQNRAKIEEALRAKAQTLPIADEINAIVTDRFAEQIGISTENRQKVAEHIFDADAFFQIATALSDELKTVSTDEAQRIVKKIKPQLLADLQKAGVEFLLTKLQSLSNETIESAVKEIARTGQLWNPALMDIANNPPNMKEQVIKPFHARFENACRREIRAFHPGVGAAAAAASGIRSSATTGREELALLLVQRVMNHTAAQFGSKFPVEGFEKFRKPHCAEYVDILRSVDFETVLEVINEMKKTPSPLGGEKYSQFIQPLVSEKMKAHFDQYYQIGNAFMESASVHTGESLRHRHSAAPASASSASAPAGDAHALRLQFAKRAVQETIKSQRFCYELDEYAQEVLDTYIAGCNQIEDKAVQDWMNVLSQVDARTIQEALSDTRRIPIRINPALDRYRLNRPCELPFMTIAGDARRNKRKKCKMPCTIL